MADKNPDAERLNQYKYSAMSNLVLQADRRFVSRGRGDEKTGDPESLAGRVNMADMGSRTAREKAPAQPGITQSSDQPRKRKRTEPAQSNRAMGALSQLDLNVEGLRYRPRTTATTEIYNLLTTQVAQKMGGDYGLHITASATDSILEYLKDPEMTDSQRQKEIDDILGAPLSNSEYNQLKNLSKKITDYDMEDEDGDGDKLSQDGEDMELDDDKQGVAVDFGEEEDEDEQNFEVRDGDSSSDEDEEDEEERNGVEAIGQGSDAEDGDEMVLSTEATERKEKSHQDGVIPAHEIDAYWLQRQIGAAYSDAHVQQEKTQQALEIMSSLNEDGEIKELRDVENDLMELFDYEQPELVSVLVINRDKIVWVTRWRRAAEDEPARLAVEHEMAQAGKSHILRELRTREQDTAQSVNGNKKSFDLMDLDQTAKKDVQERKDGLIRGLQPSKLINLENLIFDQGNHLMTNPNVRLPAGSTKRTFKGYDEIHVPAPKRKQEDVDTPNLPTSILPDWARVGFGSSKELNRIQTRCFPAAFQDDGNMLICAPTGSGKTNVAMLTMLREIGKHRNPQTGALDLDSFKIIYIAPLKALVQEQVGNFGKRLEPYGIRVAELTGDRQLTKQQISETQVIVTTPEKWDVITRKATDTSYTNLVRLICIDEIHLLHDDRGPVLESIVARTIRRTEQTGDPVRLVGLSATLPNYRDVAAFLRVDPLKGLYHFDASFRPCPLKQEFIGITEKKAIKQLKTMNDVCYTKVMEQVGQHGNQMLIFVHSRKETAKTAKYIRDKAMELETITQILKTEEASREILREEADGATSADLKDLMPYGFGIHHAGMTRADRTTVEELFSNGELRVLVCTATLAWGVNLPAHTVVIKGTQIYSPEKGSWVELSPQDVLQMLGRAGRPQFDTYGEGIIITQQTEMQYYLSLMNQQLPIESQFVSKLADNLNAEVVLGNIRTRDDGVDWLGYTYLFVRMLRSPALYQVGAEYEEDETLEQKRVDLIHAAATMLEKAHLVKYDKKSGRLQSTDLGRIASHYYITHNSMLTYNQHIQPSMTSIELFRVFALSEEFKYIPVRQDEKLELAKLMGRVPVPVKETIDEPHCKINVLLQAYISRLKLDGLALMADLVYVTQSAGRILRAIFEIAMKKGWSAVAKDALDLCKTAEKRMWPTMSPLRQFPQCPPEIIRKAEKLDVPWPSYFDLDPPRMGELLGIPRAGRQVCALVEKFPRLDVQAQVQPMTRSVLRVELTITPRFTWDDDLHGRAESFWIMVEDCDGEDILFHDQFLLRKDYAISEMNEHLVEFTVPITEPMPPNYFVTVMSDRWMHSTAQLAVSFEKLVLPEKFPAHTPLLDLQPLPVAALKRQDFVDLYPRWDNFNKIQTQVFNSLFAGDENVFVGAPTGSGKTVCAEFALLRHWSTNDSTRAVYLAPYQEQIDARLKDWQSRLASLAGGKEIVKLTGETTADLKLLERGDLILATPQQWDILSRNWQRRKNVQSVGLLIADDLHLLGGQEGYIYETVVSRSHTISKQLENGLRIVGLSVSVANGRDVGEWFGATKYTIFNFSPHVRPVPLELHIQSFSIPHFPSLMLAMSKPMYQSILNLAVDKSAMVFLPSRKQVRATAADLLGICAMADDEDRFLKADLEQLEPVLQKINERSLAESLSHGIGYFHEALSAFDKRAVEHFFQAGAIQVMLVSRDCAYEVQSSAYLSIIMGTQMFDGRQHRYIDYTIAEILQMLGKAGRPLEDTKARGVLMCPDVKRNYYKKFLSEALPIESQLQAYLHDVFVTEISAKVVTDMQDAINWFTYTYYYRRLMANPSFYGLTSATQEGFNAHLIELIETTLKELADANIIEIDEEDDSLTPLNACMIAGYYNISFITMQTLLLSLKRNTKLKGILEIVTAATEFEDIQIRRHEDHILHRIYDRVPVKMAEANFESPHFKAFVLLQAHFSRMQLPADLAKDQEVILKKVLTLLSACVDVLSSEAHLNALSAMEMSQMVVQAMWDRDSPLRQIPHFEPAVIDACNKYSITDVFGFTDAMDPEENPNYKALIKDLGLDNKQLGDAARFTNEKYPNVELNFELEDADNVTAGEASFIKVSIERDVDEEDDADLSVHAPFYPAEKSESWWLVVGDEKTKALMGIKRVTIGKKLETRMDFTVPEAGEHTLTLYLMSDSYVGVDQAPTFEVTVAEGTDEDEEEDEE